MTDTSMQSILNGKNFIRIVFFSRSKELLLHFRMLLLYNSTQISLLWTYLKCWVLTADMIVGMMMLIQNWEVVSPCSSMYHVGVDCGWLVLGRSWSLTMIMLVYNPALAYHCLLIIYVLVCWWCDMVNHRRE